MPLKNNSYQKTALDRIKEKRWQDLSYLEKAVDLFYSEDAAFELEHIQKAKNVLKSILIIYENIGGSIAEKMIKNIIYKYFNEAKNIEQ